MMDPRIKLSFTLGYRREDYLTKTGRQHVIDFFINNTKLKLDDIVYFNPGMVNHRFKGTNGNIPLEAMGQPFRIIEIRNKICTYWKESATSLIETMGIDTDDYYQCKWADVNQHVLADLTVYNVAQYRVKALTPEGELQSGNIYFYPQMIKENKWVPIFPDGIPPLEDIDYDDYEPYQDHKSAFCMMVGDGVHEYKNTKWFFDNIPEYEEEDYDDYCDTCDDGDCSDCNRPNHSGICSSGPIPAALGTDSSCWGNGMPVLRCVEQEWGIVPTHMVLLLDRVSLWEAGNTYEDISRFYGYMQDAGIIPRKGVKLLTEDDKNKNATVFFSNISEMSPEKMYFIFCCMRTPVQHPGIVRLTNRLIEQKDMDPLYAFLMAQITHPCFQGGHAVISPRSLRYYQAISWEDRIGNKVREPAKPILDTVVKYALRVVKLLDKDRGARFKIKNTKVDHWLLDRILVGDQTYPGWCGYADAHPIINVRYSRDLKLTPNNILGLYPRERRIVS